MDNQIVIPTSFHSRILENLHSAHQGLNGMECMPEYNSLYTGPVRIIACKTIKQTCQTCIQIAPGQAKEPIEMSATPES